jgi:hypothetical protein
LEFHKIGGSYQLSIFLTVLIISVPFKPRQKKTKENKYAENQNNKICTHSIFSFTLDHFCRDTGNKGITGIVLYDGTVIEGQILFMSADIVKIRTKDGNTSSYSFIKEVQSFIKE